VSTPWEAAFADPVHDAQTCFRAVLDAMAHPGRIIRVTGVSPPVSLCIAAAAVLLTLTDHDTALWLEDGTAQNWIGFHTGAPFVTDPRQCAFALLNRAPDFAQFSAGTHEEPETSATVIWQVGSLAGGRRFRLTGPGLREPFQLSIDGAGSDFAASWRANHALFPRGIDLILCAGDQLTALPRSTAIEEI